MIWRARNRYDAPYGRIDGVIYYGGTVMPIGYSPVWSNDGSRELVYFDDTVPHEAIVHVPDAALSDSVILYVGGAYPSASGELITDIDPAQLIEGRSLSAVRGQNITDLTADNISPGGVLPALDGSALTGLPFTGGSGFPGSTWLGIFNLDGDGQLDLLTQDVPPLQGGSPGFNVIANWGDYTPVGQLQCVGTIVRSTAGVSDASGSVAVLVCYQ